MSSPALTRPESDGTLETASPARETMIATPTITSGDEKAGETVGNLEVTSALKNMWVGTLSKYREKGDNWSMGMLIDYNHALRLDGLEKKAATFALPEIIFALGALMHQFHEHEWKRILVGPIPYRGKELSQEEFQSIIGNLGSLASANMENAIGEAKIEPEYLPVLEILQQYCDGKLPDNALFESSRFPTFQAGLTELFNYLMARRKAGI